MASVTLPSGGGLVNRLRDRLSAYAAFAALPPKIYLAYSIWFWVSLVLNVIAMSIFVFFWRAVYANTNSIAGLDLRTTLNYLMLAQIFAGLTNLQMIFEFGYNMREGGIAHALLRPVDFQLSYYSQYLMISVVETVMQIPLAIAGTLLFGLTWPTDPVVWLVFLVTAILGRTVLFFFDWILACLTFYTTEVWGLGVLVGGLGLFLSGSLVPLPMMPVWLRTIVASQPFAQAMYVPLSLLTRIEPLSSAPRLWLTQLIWLVGLGIASRLVFKFAVRKVTVQGG